MLRVLLYLIPLALAIYALVDCIQTPEDEIKGIPRIGWILLIVLIWIIGPITWLIAGRDRGTGRSAPRTRTSGPSGAGTGRVLAPDDDPDFLRDIARRNRQRKRDETDETPDEHPPTS